MVFVVAVCRLGCRRAIWDALRRGRLLLLMHTLLHGSLFSVHHKFVCYYAPFGRVLYPENLGTCYAFCEPLQWPLSAIERCLSECSQARSGSEVRRVGESRDHTDDRPGGCVAEIRGRYGRIWNWPPPTTERPASSVGDVFIVPAVDGSVLRSGAIIWGRCNSRFVTRGVLGTLFVAGLGRRRRR